MAKGKGQRAQGGAYPLTAYPASPCPAAFNPKPSVANVFWNWFVLQPPYATIEHLEADGWLNRREIQQFRDDSTGPKVRGQFKRHEPQDLEGGFCYLAADGHK